MNHLTTPDRQKVKASTWGEGYYWNPEALPNEHIVAIGALDSGKTRTLKAIACAKTQN